LLEAPLLRNHYAVARTNANVFSLPLGATVKGQ